MAAPTGLRDADSFKKLNAAIERYLRDSECNAATSSALAAAMAEELDAIADDEQTKAAALERVEEIRRVRELLAVEMRSQGDNVKPLSECSLSNSTLWALIRLARRITQQLSAVRAAGSDEALVIGIVVCMSGAPRITLEDMHCSTVGRKRVCVSPVRLPVPGLTRCSVQTRHLPAPARVRLRRCSSSSSARTAALAVRTHRVAKK